ncbi:MAG: hypothetical protein KGH66_02520 [Candidatus Micrarchaeota archaeon]|nr:hypothetical protein [Candidatus Micrarchaeota archaeon]
METTIKAAWNLEHVKASAQEIIRKGGGASEAYKEPIKLSPSGNVVAISKDVCVKFTDFDSELTLLERLHAADSVHTTQPLLRIEGPNGKLIGYSRERVSMTIGQFKARMDRKIVTAAAVDMGNQLMEAISNYHKANLMHGDINDRNVGISVDGKLGFVVKCSDPLHINDGGEGKVVGTLMQGIDVRNAELLIWGLKS